MVEQTDTAGRDTEPMSVVNARAPERVKQAAIALARRRGMKLSGLVNTLLIREIEDDHAQRLAGELVATPPRGHPAVDDPTDGARPGLSRNVTARVLTGGCLHPIHMREPHRVGERCGGCGQTFARNR